MQKEELWSD